MGEGECENVAEEQAKKSRHRKKHLYNTILQQMEFYFGDSNLSKDRFLSQLLSESPYVDLQVFLKFNKIKKLNCTLDDIRKAISKSEIIELSEDKEKVCRKKPMKVKENVEECTVYVENIKTDANHDWLRQVFAEFGNVVYVSIPKYKHNKLNKGFAFIEYNTEKEANDALEFFESIGCKMPADRNPEELQSIATFEGNSEEKGEKMDEKSEDSDCENVKKRKLSVSEEANEEKKAKTDEGNKTENEGEMEEGESKKKKKTKKEKKKSYIKDLGMQVLSKKEWKKMRNRYLDLQKKKMKEFKQYLYKQKFAPKSYEKGKVNEEIIDPIIEEALVPSPAPVKLEFMPGIIVKLKLPEPCSDAKKLKNEIKATCSEIKYVDVPLPAGSEEVFLRFGDSESAINFCEQDALGQKIVLEGDEEKSYWDKIQNDRNVKFAKSSKKMRGRDKLLKKAEKERAKHIRFEEGE